MGTQSSDIIDLFMKRVDDYRLDTVYTTSGSLVFSNYIEPWIMDAADEFDICDQSLTYVTSGSATEGYFVEDLTMRNKILLSKLVVKYWFERTVQNILQMNNAVGDRDFKTFSASQNLKAKQDYLNSLKEELSQDLMNYAYRNNDWAGWKNQQFDN